jgi:hypothetical protein
LAVLAADLLPSATEATDDFADPDADAEVTAELLVAAPAGLRGLASRGPVLELPFTVAGLCFVILGAGFDATDETELLADGA